MLDLSPRDYILPHMLRRAGRLFADRPFVQFPERARTYAEADAAADRVAHGLADLGAGKGTKVAIMAVNSLAFIDACWGRRGWVPSMCQSTPTTRATSSASSSPRRT